MAAAQALVRERHPALATFLVGHSHGGLIVLLLALRRPESLPGIVITSPFLGIHPASRPSAALALAARILSRLAPALRFSIGLDPRNVSRDEAVVRAYVSDPLVGRKASSRWFTALLAAFEEVHAGASALRVPTLLMAAGDDRVVDAEATRRFAEAAQRDRLEFLPWHGLYHEVFNEPEKEQVFRKMESWLEARLSVGIGGPG